MTTKRSITLTLTAALAASVLAFTCACSTGKDSSTSASGSAPTTELAPPAEGLSRVLWLGDSIADGLSLPLSFAFDAAKVEFSSIAAAGGGTVVGDLGKTTWETLDERLRTMKPSTVVYQVTTYDWGSSEELERAYQRLVDAAGDAKVIFVTVPPIAADDFYAPHLEDLARTTAAAQAVAERSGGRAHVLDASAVWGTSFTKTVDGKRYRSDDGIHTCPQGAARFTNWLLDGLSDVYPAFTPPAASKWANAGWASDKAFIGC
ncbi:SGNH/GDSL hydrolase family protein [Leifsonia sp. McL0607]|uniref:SGNH/GDSL hydrolase family protein n=1 Tax=Leifsonia sp. McL0607 TaxID=3415672 RepID=UPI003CF04765